LKKKGDLLRNSIPAKAVRGAIPGRGSFFSLSFPYR
jgi:hypothetical protein